MQWLAALGSRQWARIGTAAVKIITFSFIYSIDQSVASTVPGQPQFADCRNAALGQADGFGKRIRSFIMVYDNRCCILMELSRKKYAITQMCIRYGGRDWPGRFGRFRLILSQSAAAYFIDGTSRNFRGYRQTDWSTDGNHHACNSDKRYTKCLTPWI